MQIDLAEIQTLFSSFHPLTVERSGRQTAQVCWATAANSARAMLELSRGVGEAGRTVRHVLGGPEVTEQTVVEDGPAQDLVHPDDIGLELPPDGPWRLARLGEDGSIALLRFGRRTDLSGRERRSVGVLSRSKREELLAERERAVEREAERKHKPVDRKNPWGAAAELWAVESRGRVGREFDKYEEKQRLLPGARRDWDDPVELERETQPRSGRPSIKDRLDMNRRVDVDEEEEEDEELDWSERMKRPRMGMVADLVERRPAGREDGRELIRRKVARRVQDEEEEEKGGVLRRGAEAEPAQRVIRTAGRRLGLSERFQGGRLAGRLGTAAGDGEDGPDLRMDIKRKLIIKVDRSNEDAEGMEEDGKQDGLQLREESEDEIPFQSPRENQEKYDRENREKEIRKRLKEIQREKDLIDERRKGDVKSELTKEEKKRKERRDYEKKKEELLRRKDQEKRKSKNKSKKRYSSDESSSDSSESEKSESEESSESSEESSDESTDSSESSDSEEERRRRRRKLKEKEVRKKEHSRHKDSRHSYKEDKQGASSSKHSVKKEKESEEDKKKAAELRDQLKNYLKKAKEAKEKRKK